MTDDNFLSQLFFRGEVTDYCIAFDNYCGRVVWFERPLGWTPGLHYVHQMHKGNILR